MDPELAANRVAKEFPTKKSSDVGQYINKTIVKIFSFFIHALISFLMVLQKQFSVHSSLAPFCLETFH